MIKLGVTTLGCPEWTFSQILTNVKSYGYDGLELRGLGPDIDLVDTPGFNTPAALQQTRRDVENAGLEIFAIDTSTLLTKVNQDNGIDSLKHAKRNIDLAAALGASYIRVFGGASPEGETRESVTARVVDNIRSLGEYAAKNAASVIVLLESHDAFSSGKQVGEVVALANHPNVAALWDLHHPYRHGETPDESYAALAPFLKLTHVKDSQPPNTYCLLGEGDVPIPEMLAILVRNGYSGYLSMEWEKRWHPHIPDAEIAFPQYANKLREYLAELA